MDKVTFVEVEMLGGVQSHAIIQHADGSQTSMLKSTYEAQQVEHLTEIPTKATYEATLVTESAPTA